MNFPRIFVFKIEGRVTKQEEGLFKILKQEIKTEFNELAVSW